MQPAYIRPVDESQDSFLTTDIFQRKTVCHYFSTFRRTPRLFVIDVSVRGTTTIAERHDVGRACWSVGTDALSQPTIA